MQGQKGLGRYAAAILGNNLTLRTVCSSGDKTEVEVNWADFDNAEYMDQVTLPVRTQAVKECPQTLITIYGEDEFYDFWKGDEYNNLRFELKKLVSPIHDGEGVGTFDIYLEIDDDKEGGLLQK